MKVRSGLLLLLIVLIHVGATNPNDSKTGNSKKPRSNHSALGPQGVVSDSIVNFFTRNKTGKDLMAEKTEKEKSKTVKPKVSSGKPEYGQAGGGVGGGALGKVVLATPVTIQKVSPVVAIANIPSVSKVYRVPPLYKAQPFAVAPPPVSRVSASPVRQEIQKILELNKLIKMAQSGRSVQFQHVQEQAIIHQNVLNQTAASKAGEAEPAPAKSGTTDDVMNQEKLRVKHRKADGEVFRAESVANDMLSAASKVVPASNPQSKST